MKILAAGTTSNGTELRIEEWNENYSFVPYGSTIAAYAKSKVSHPGPFAPRGNELYRFQFDFKSNSEAQEAFSELMSGNKHLADYKVNMERKEYSDCI